jgi:hypothetical protein
MTLGTVIAIIAIQAVIVLALDATDSYAERSR